MFKTRGAVGLPCRTTPLLPKPSFSNNDACGGLGKEGVTVKETEQAPAKVKIIFLHPYKKLIKILFPIYHPTIWLGGGGGHLMLVYTGI